MSIFQYNFVPEEELSVGKVLLNEGKCHFKIKNYYDKNQDGSPSLTSKGEPKITLALQVTDIIGQVGKVFDIFTSNMPWKIAQLSKALGMPELYNESGSINLNSLLEKEGECIIKTEKRHGYNPKSIVGSYLPHPESPTFRQENTKEDDDLPW